MQSTHVTNRQGVQLARQAREAGILREKFAEFLNDKNMTTKFFEGLVGDSNWFEKLQTEALKIGARVHLIKIAVDYTRPHNEVALAGGPKTPANYNVLKVADKYKPSEDKITEETIILLNFSKGDGGYKKAKNFAFANDLLPTSPHIPFAIGEQKPDLNQEIGMSSMYVVETTGCTFEGNAFACRVWWDDAERESDLCWLGSFGNSNDWFAFRKKKLRS
jgi:hypothetical protein